MANVKKSTAKFSVFLPVMAIFFLLKSNPTYAYLDPGSISLFMQGIIAAVMGIVFTWKYWLWRILDFFGLSKKNKQKEDAKDEEMKM